VESLEGAPAIARTRSVPAMAAGQALGDDLFPRAAKRALLLVLDPIRPDMIVPTELSASARTAPCGSSARRKLVSCHTTLELTQAALAGYARTAHGEATKPPRVRSRVGMAATAGRSRR